MINRCQKCNHKTSVPLKCKCGNNYCPKDILPEKHNCSELIIFRRKAYEDNKKMLMDFSQKEKPEWI